MFQKLWKTLFVAALLIFIAMSDAIADDGTAYESTDQPSVNAAETGVQELPDDTSAIASRTSGDPGFTYGAAARDWVEGVEYFALQNDAVKLTIGTVRLDKQHPTDYSDEQTGNNRWGSLTPGHIMDAAPTFNMHDNLDYTEFVLRTEPHRTWWYPHEKLSLPNISTEDHTVTASGQWDYDGNIQADVTYSLVQNSPLIKMKVNLRNVGEQDFTGHLAYIIDSDEQLEQQSYVPGWGWRGGQVNEYITSGWNHNYIFNGIQDKYTGNTAHAIIWPDDQQPSALIPEGYITGAWFQVELPAGDSEELVLYHLPHDPGPGGDAYQTAEFWAEVVKQGIDPSTIGTITGTITDSAGNPSAHVKVTLKSVSDDADGIETEVIAGSAETDSRGMYSIYALMDRHYLLEAANGTDYAEREVAWSGTKAQLDFEMAAPDREIITGLTKGDPGFKYEGTSRDWWPAHDYYYIESPDIKFTVGMVRTAGKDPVDWSNDASGNNKWGSLTPGHIMDASSKLNMHENLDFTEFVLSDDLGVTPEDEANGKYMEWSWFHPLTKLQMPDIELQDDAIVASGSWDYDEKMESTVRYSIVRGTPLVKMEITLENRTGKDFAGDFAFIIDPDQPGEQHSYLPGVNWVYAQESNGIKSGWTDNYLFNGVNNTFTGKTAHVIIWPEDQQPSIVMHEGIFAGTWFEANIPDGASEEFVIYYLPHVAGPADKPYAVAEFWAEFIREGRDPEDISKISGTVTEQSGQPVMFTEMVLLDESGQEAARTVTNDEGKYEVFVDKGVYELIPLTKEYFATSQIVDVSEAKRVEADFTLVKLAEIELEIPATLLQEQLFDIHVTVSNVSDQRLDDITVQLDAPYMIHFLDEAMLKIENLEAGEQALLSVTAVAVDGGRASIQAEAVSRHFQILAEQSFNAVGEGYYSGDNHTHSVHSDGVHSIAENSATMYEKRLHSWGYVTEHNTFSHQQDAQDVSQSYDGHFYSLAGAEITTPLGHALVYGIDQAPNFQVDGITRTWQDSIDEITSSGGLFYLAHPFEQTYAFQTPYEWRGFTGVEVWNGTWHALDGNVNEQAFRFWDEINIRGDNKYYGIANTDGHTKDKVGDTYSKGHLTELSEDNIVQLLGSGKFYGSNGPDIRFHVDGIEMGGTLQIHGARLAAFHIEAYDPNSNLTSVKLIKYPVTGDIADYAQREVVFQANELHTDTFIETIMLPVEDGQFYRLEVRSEKASEGSSGIGPLTGTGFAFSNPIWVEEGEASNAKALLDISYRGGSLFKDEFGMDALHIKGNNGQRFHANKLVVKVSEGAELTDISYQEILDDKEFFGLLHLTVTAEDDSSAVYKVKLIGEEKNPHRPK